MKGFLFALILSMFIGSAALAGGNSDKKGSSSSTSMGQIPAGVVVIAETTYVDIQKLPLMFMDEARSEISQKNFGTAAADLRAASKILRVETSSDPKADPKKIADRLDKLADQVKSQQIKDEAQLNAQLASIGQDKALQSRFNAERAWAEKQGRRAGHDMEVSLAALEHAAKWSGKKIEGATAGAVSDARKVSGKLIEGAGYTSTEVGKGFERLGTAISGLGQKTEGTQSATTSELPDESTASGTTSSPMDELGKGTESGTTQSPQSPESTTESVE